MQFDPSVEGKRETYFRLIECIVPRPIAWISTCSASGVRNLAPYSFFTGVSASPPTLLFCAGNKPRGVLKDTVSNIIETKEFVVNVVPAHLGEVMVQTSAPYALGVDEFTMTHLEERPSERVRPPRVALAPVSFECRLHSIQELEDDQGRISSRIVIGRIELIHMDENVLNAQGRVDPKKLNPLGRIGGQDYCELGTLRTIARPTEGS